MATTRPFRLAAALAILALGWLPAWRHDAEIQRVTIVDADGKEVGLYTASHALVIGIADYTAGWLDLPGVPTDVEAVSRVLEAHGFAVRREIDLDHQALDRVIREFIAERGQEADARLVIYFAGHGHTLEQSFGGEMGYLVPANAPPPDRDPAGFVARALPMRQVEVYAEMIQSKHALFLFDSSFSGSIFSRERSVPGHISARAAQPVRQFITAGSAGEEVPDDSIFRRQFVAALEGEGDINGDGYVTGSELGEFLYDTVVNFSRGTQHPQYGKIRHPGLDEGDFVFRLPSPPAQSATPPIERPPEEVSFSLDDLESEADQIEETREAWAEYLKQMQAAFQRADDYEGRSVDGARKVEAWRRFLSAFGGDSLFSQEDEALRQRATERLEYWREAARIVEEIPLPAPELPAEAKPGDPWSDPVLEMRFRYVPPGIFRMGSPEEEQGRDPAEEQGRDSAEELHTVTLSRGYWMGETEVTQKQFARFVEATGYRTEAEKEGWSWIWTGEEWEKRRGLTWRQSGGEEYPVVHVSWNDASAFSDWAGRETGAEIRLPTEAEWERAARAGMAMATYAGDLTLRSVCDAPELEEIAWYCGNSGLEAHPVGGKEANAWGLRDMLGSVWEWVEDADPHAARNSRRTFRGGSWVEPAGDSRAARRVTAPNSDRSRYVGFRVVRGLSGAAASRDAVRRGAARRGVFVPVPAKERAVRGFDAEESAGLFVGVRRFDTEAFAEVPYAVDDAVDLAHLFALELELIAPEKVVLSLAGEPQKSESQDGLAALLAAGAKRRSAKQPDIYSLVDQVGRSTGEQGLFVVALATHGFSGQGGDYLVASDSLSGRHIKNTGVKVNEIFEGVAGAAARRRLVFLDACRERLYPVGPRGGAAPMSPSFAAAIADATGQVVFAGATAGGFAYDDPERGNGVFSGAVLDGLRGQAVADERSFITVLQLARFVDRRVVEWVGVNRPEHAELSQGVALQLDAVAVADMPLAVDSAAREQVEEERRRIDSAILKLSQNLDGPISGVMYDEMVEILRSRQAPRELWLALIEEIEALDGSERLQRSLRDWFHEHRAALQRGPQRAVPEPSQESPRPEPESQSPPTSSRPVSKNGAPEPGDVWRSPALGMRFRYVPAGTFRMGSPEGEKGRNEDEKLHAVTLTRGFWMGETEVTQGQWRQLMDNNPSGFQDGGEACPVEKVSWWDAVVFANRLSERVGLETCYELDCQGTPGTGEHTCESVRLRSRQCQGFRLPTEAEWERAARAGGSAATYYLPDVRRIAWYDDNSGNKTHPAGGKQANDWGLEDMLGNVWEWVEDSADFESLRVVIPIYVGVSKDPLSTVGSERVFRGGSWLDLARDVRSAVRHAASPGYRDDYRGFRLARGQGE